MESQFEPPRVESRPIVCKLIKTKHNLGIGQIKVQKSDFEPPHKSALKWNSKYTMYTMSREWDRKKSIFIDFFSMVTKAIFLQRAKLCLLFNVCFTSAHVHGISDGMERRNKIVKRAMLLILFSSQSKICFPIHISLALTALIWYIFFCFLLLVSVLGLSFSLCEYHATPRLLREAAQY